MPARSPTSLKRVWAAVLSLLRIVEVARDRSREVSPRPASRARTIVADTMSTLTVLAISKGAPLSQVKRRPVVASSTPTPKATYLPCGRATSAASRAPWPAKAPAGTAAAGAGVAAAGAGVGVGVGVAVGAGAGAVARTLVVVALAVGAGAVIETGSAAGVRSVPSSMTAPRAAPPKSAMAERRVTHAGSLRAAAAAAARRWSGVMRWRPGRCSLGAGDMAPIVAEVTVPHLCDARRARAVRRAANWLAARHTALPGSVVCRPSSPSQSARAGSPPRR